MRLRILSLLMMFTLLLSMSDCDQHAGNAPQYVDAAGKAYTIAQDGNKEYAEAKTKIEKAQAAVEAIGKTATVVTAVVPGAQGVGTAVVAVCGVVSAILGIFAIKKNKQLKLEKAKVKDWNEAVEAGIADGDDKKVVSVEVLKEVLDTPTKTDFNALGKERL